MSPSIPLFILILWTYLAYARVFGKLDTIFGHFMKKPFTEFSIFFFGTFIIIFWGAYLAG